MREYAFAVGSPDPTTSPDGADLPDDEIPVPATFAACFTVIRGGAAMFADAELGAHPALVHGTQSFELHRPVRVGDVLTCTPWIAEILVRGRHEFLTLQIDCTDADGGPVVTSRGTIIFLGSAPAAGAGDAAPDAPPATTGTSGQEA